MKIYNTLTRSIEEIVPIDDRTIKMYTCGLTVYSQPQIGNWVAYIYSDVLHRSLLLAGFSVNRTQNITDVGHLVSDDDAGEDKMEKGAKAEGMTAWEVAEKYARIASHEAFDILGLLRPTHLIRATDLIPEQIAFVEQLEAKGYTYIIEDEGVYFDTSKLQDYGKLARLDIKGLQAGARVEIGGKKHPTDFALWKFSPKGQKRDMEWESPWGIGFPGWHLECSVIARESLGDQIDIHTGGIDHIPVHHTNEIAQTESLTGKQFVKYWFHNNHIKVNGAKLAKSAGNSYTLSEIIERGYNVNVFKLMVLSSHYSTEGNFTWEIMDAAKNRYQRWQSLVDRKWQVAPKGKGNGPYEITDYIKTITGDLLNNIDTPTAIKHIDEAFDMIENHGIVNTYVEEIEVLVAFIENALGITFQNEDISTTQKASLQARQNAKQHKDYDLADKLRDKLASEGIEINDTAAGQIWFRTV